jgi:hypothetical protein
MNRITRSTMRRLPPRTTVISGAALGLVAGAAVYGAVSSSAEATTQTAFKAKAPVAVAHVSAANCAANSKLEKGVCVVHVVRTVVVPPSAASIASQAKAAHAAGTTRTAGSTHAAGTAHAAGTTHAAGTGESRANKATASHAAMKKAERAEEGRLHFGEGSRWESREDFEADFEDGWTGTSAPTPTPTVSKPAPAPAPVPVPVPTTTTPAPAPAPVPTAAS